MKNLQLKKITLSSILSALALLSFMLENLLPTIIFPNARIGLSNIFILLALVILGYKYAFAVLIIKITLGSIFSGNVSAILYSLPAGVCSLIIETILLKFYKKLSILSISVVGAVVNSLIQNTMFCVITSTFSYFIYLPYLTLISVGAGLIIGLLTYLIIKYLPQNIFITFLENNGGNKFESI